MRREVSSKRPKPSFQSKFSVLQLSKRAYQSHSQTSELNEQYSFVSNYYPLMTMDLLQPYTAATHTIIVSK